MKCGIEIHQRLSGTKLFCGCSADIDENAKPVREVIRKQHAVVSELGEVDAAAQFEYLRDRTFVYQIFPNNCEVELDDEPPHPVSKETLAAAIEICLLLKAQPVDEVQVMRKAVIDGSNTSGFQRTSIIGLNGVIETSKGPVGIPAICLEEESAGIIGEEAGTGKITYRLDRLGIPLVEIATSPDIKDGEHCREVAEKIGTLLRMTGKVQRGIGTIRQDVNVSTEAGARVEIKGAQDLAMLSTMVDIEVKRQQKLLEIRAQIHARLGGKKLEVSDSPSDCTSIFKSTSCKLIKKALDDKGVVFGLKLPYHAGLVGTEIAPDRRYGSELSDYAKAAGVKGIIHSDEDMAKYTISEREAADVRKLLGCKEDDAFVLVASDSSRAKNALLNLRTRALMTKLPEETRRALPSGASAYMRPLPGKARLYPETDIPPIRVTSAMLTERAANLSETPEEKLANLSKVLTPDLAKKLLKSKHLPLFEKLSSSYPSAEPTLIATTLEETLTALRREGTDVKDVSSAMESLLTAYSSGGFVKSAIPDILREMAKSSISAEEAVAKLGISKITGAELSKIVEENKGDMKSIMAKYRTRVDAAEVSKLLSASRSRGH